MTESGNLVSNVGITTYGAGIGRITCIGTSRSINDSNVIMSCSSNFRVYSICFSLTYGTVGHGIISATYGTCGSNVIFGNGCTVGVTGCGNGGVYSARFSLTYGTVGNGIVTACYRT